MSFKQLLLFFTFLTQMIAVDILRKLSKIVQDSIKQDSQDVLG